jgi:hypothetical protein
MAVSVPATSRVVLNPVPVRASADPRLESHLCGRDARQPAADPRGRRWSARRCGAVRALQLIQPHQVYRLCATAELEARLIGAVGRSPRHSTGPGADQGA